MTDAELTEDIARRARMFVQVFIGQDELTQIINLIGYVKVDYQQVYGRKNFGHTDFTNFKGSLLRNPGEVVHHMTQAIADQVANKLGV